MQDDKKFKRLAPLAMSELMRTFKLTDWRAAAIMGNAGHESAGLTILQEIKPTVEGSRGGYGWFQWTGPRRRAFEKWAAGKGLALDSYEANVGFLTHELRGPERGALDALRKAASLRQATVAFEQTYERAGVKHHASRIAWAEKALAAYQAKGGNPKPIAKSGTVAGAGTAAAGGAAVVVDAATTAQEQLGRANDAWSAGTWIGIALGVLIVAGAGYAIYRRWVDAGRPSINQIFGDDE